MSLSEEGHSNELNFVLLGSAQKSVLFEKLCEAAAKYERHVHYPDIHYLTVRMGDREDCVEVSDPGLARTGGREMAIKNADVALLYYSAHLKSSLDQLRTVKEDLMSKHNMPIRLICDTDEVGEYEEDGGSTGISSQSEGYESDPEHDSRIRRHPSMDQIRKASENVEIGVQAGREFATELGESCVFIKISGSTYPEGEGLLRDMVNAARSNRKRRRSRSIIPALKIRSKSRDAKVSPQTSLKSEQSSSVDDTNSRKSSETKNSKVCVIM